MYVKEQFKNKIKNTEAQIGKILRTPSLTVIYWFL